MEFYPVDQGREPGGFSGAGAWYQVHSEKPPIVWFPSPILAGLITDFHRTAKVLEICRIESIVMFLVELTDDSD